MCAGPDVDGLIDSLVEVSGTDKSMTIQKHIAEFEIDAGKAVIIGIIINELLTNVFKYAFEDRDDGLVTVSIAKQQHNVTLIIQDNGRGFDESVDSTESPGFGLMLVRMLVEQLGGTYSQFNDNGARSVVRFDI